MMKKRDATSKKAKNLRLRRAFLLVTPLVLAGGAWKIGDLQKPIDIDLAPGEDKRSQELFSRMGEEFRDHPYAATVVVERVTPWPKESGLELNDSEVLIYNRGTGTLEYSSSGGAGGYGWTFGKVKPSDLNYLASANIGQYALNLKPQVESNLRKRGCILVERMMP